MSSLKPTGPGIVLLILNASEISRYTLQDSHQFLIRFYSDAIFFIHFFSSYDFFSYTECTICIFIFLRVFQVFV